MFSITRTGILLLLLGHLGACVAVLFLMPGGWPTGSIETLGYRVLPIAFACMLGAAVLLPRRLHADRLALALLLGLWLGVAIAAAMLFPISGPRIAAGASVVVLVLCVSLAGTSASITRRALIARVAVTCAAAAVAVIPVRLLQSPPATTRVGDHILGEIAPGTAERRTLRLDANYALDPTQAIVTVTAGKRYAYVSPVLTFVQRSPDACWTIFAPRAARVPPSRTLQSTASIAGSLEATYIDSAQGVTIASDRLRVTHVDDRTATIDAASFVARPVWSHLNTFTELTVAGHRDLSLRFSPTFDVPIKVTNAGYPIGAPARFAYIDREKIFHIVEATSAEKGPFKELAVGRLEGALTITLCDGDEPFLEMRLDDWASQASVELSPTAGWGVPQNSIEFGLQSENPKSPATIFVSLASTSVGRGWNSVGHAAGVYRNRMRLRTIGP